VGRSLLATVAVVLAAAGAAGAASGPPAFTLTMGQTRWFLPGALQPNALVRCVEKGGEIHGTVPAPAAGALNSIDLWDHAGRSISLDVRPNGAVEVRCGARAVAAAEFRRPTLPYVVGRNGVGLLRGPNTLARIRRLYGPGAAAPRGGACRVTWPSAGLTAVFAGARCTDGALLVGATVTGAKWSSLSGVRVGDPVGRMVWEDQTAKLLSRAHGRRTWVLGGLGSKGQRLLAVSNASGRITSLVLATR
jgi:hypothetical protein